MPSTKRTTFARALLLCLASAVGARGDSFSYPANRLGFADHNGGLCLWAGQGWEIEGEDHIPLRFRFRPGQERGRGLLGINWWVPLLESEAVELSETTVRVSTLGGEYISLSRAREMEDSKVLYESYDKKWSATLNQGRREFDVSAPDGWKYHYLGGLLASAVAPDGRKIRWLRSNGKVSEITDSSNGSILSAKYTKSGLISEIATADRVFSIRHAMMPVRVPVAPGMFALKMEEYADLILLNGSEVAKVDVLDASQEELMLGVSGKAFAPVLPLTETKIKCDAVSGLLSSVNDMEYKYGKDETGSSIAIIQKGKTVESYSWDKKTLVETRELEGRVQKTHYIGSPGPCFMKVSRVERSTGELNKFYYTKDGNRTRQVVTKNGESTTYLWDQAARQFIDLERSENYGLNPLSKAVADIEGRLSKLASTPK